MYKLGFTDSKFSGLNWFECTHCHERAKPNQTGITEEQLINAADTSDSRLRAISEKCKRMFVRKNIWAGVVLYLLLAAAVILVWQFRFYAATTTAATHKIIKVQLGISATFPKQSKWNSLKKVSLEGKSNMYSKHKSCCCVAGSSHGICLWTRLKLPIANYCSSRHHMQSNRLDFKAFQDAFFITKQNSDWKRRLSQLQPIRPDDSLDDKMTRIISLAVEYQCPVIQ